MKKIAFFFCVVTVLLFFGCSQVENHKELGLYSTGNVLRIPIKSTSNSTSRNVRYFKDKGEEYIAVENEQTRCISIYGLSDTSYVKDVVPQVQGPNGLNGRMFGFDIINLDTIFVSINGFGDRYYMIDSDANLKKTIEFEVQFNPFVALPLGFLSSFGWSVYKSDDVLFVGNVCRDELDRFRMMHEYSIGYCYDMKADSFYRDERHYPDIRELNPNVDVSPSSFIVNDDKLILSYMSGHQIFVYNGSKWDVHDMRSRYINYDFESRSTPSDAQTSMTQYVQRPEYRALIYDKYRNVYYRIAYPGIEVEATDDVFMLGEFRRVFSVMIIDSDFNLVGETLMPEKTYNVNMFFVNEKGLWISTNNVENPHFEEDAINFELLELR